MPHRGSGHESEVTDPGPRSSQPGPSEPGPSQPPGNGPLGRFRVRLMRLAERTRAIPFVGKLTVQLVHVNVLDTATRLAAQTFLTGIPVLFVLAAFAPAAVRDNLVDSLRSILGLGSRPLAEIRGTLQAGHDTEVETFGGIGVVVTLLSATACSRVLQRLCERSWHLPPAAARLAAWRWVAWLVVWLAVLVFQGKVREGFGVGQGLGLPMALATACLMWWWTQYLLLAGRMPWLPLLPGAVLTGVAMTALAGAAKIYVPNSLDRSISQFGPLGLVFTLFSWLIVLFTAATVCVATGYVIAHEPAVARLLKTPPAPDSTD
ncbi:membrane protein [Catenulispora sp. MAP5-51]